MTDADREAKNHEDSRKVWLGSVEPAAARVPTSSLLPAVSPRSSENQEHVRMLAECEATLPPIIVHRQSMRVVDGMHRLHAAILRGDAEIDVRWYCGDDKSAFVWAVRANVSHGLALSLAERLEAAKRILRSHPEWSDRMIASIVGLAPKTIEPIRADADRSAKSPQEGRIGQDGRVRPLNAASARRLAGDLIAQRPAATLREIATEAGLAPSTVKDVRERVLSGRDPVPERQRRNEATTASAASSPEDEDQPVTVAPFRKVRRNPDQTLNPATQVQLLRKDPSMRFNEMGRALLRSLDVNITSPDDRARIVDAIPPHCVDTVTALAQATAQAWSDLADQLSTRPQQPVPRTAKK